MSSPKKRSMSALKSISPTKCTNTRKLVLVTAGAVADGTVGIVIAEKEGGGKDKEPFTNPARVAILNRGTEGMPNALIDAGFFMVASKTVDENSDTAQRTERGYDYKVFVASVDTSLIVNSFSALKGLALKFCDFMNTQRENKYERYALAATWNLTPVASKTASSFILCNDAVKGLKMLFGEALDPDNPDILNMPPKWGSENENIIALWFQTEKLTSAHRVELGITLPAANRLGLDNSSDDSDDDDLKPSAGK